MKPLNPYQLRILRLVLAGKSNTEIAADLDRKTSYVVGEVYKIGCYFGVPGRRGLFLSKEAQAAANNGDLAIK